MEKYKYKCKSVGVVGAGIQGVCVGLQLIKKGIPATIFDRQDPLSSEFKSASYGNAGHFSPYAVLQFNRPDVLFSKNKEDKKSKENGSSETVLNKESEYLA